MSNRAIGKYCLILGTFAFIFLTSGRSEAFAQAPTLKGGLIAQNAPDNSCSDGCGGWFDWGTGSQGLPCQNGFARSFWIRGTDPAGPILNDRQVTSWGCGQPGTPLSAMLNAGTNDFTVLFGTGYPLGPGPWDPVTVDVSIYAPGSSTPVAFHVGQENTGIFGGPLSVTQMVGTAQVTLVFDSFSQPGIYGIPGPATDRISNNATGPDGYWDGIVHIHFDVVLPPDAPPVAVTGGPYSVVEHQPVLLNGTGSYDDNGPVSFSWSVASTPPGSNGGMLVNANTATPTFTPDMPGTFTLKLVVTDNIGQTGSAIATLSSTNVAPIANAGPSVATYVGAPVSLDGSLSYDPNGDSITFAWTLARPTGSTAALSSSNTATPMFTPDVAGQYTATLTVTDQWGLSGPTSIASTLISVATPGDYAQSQSTSAINQVNVLPPTSVTSAGNQQALSNFLHQTIQAVQSNNIAQAINKLQSAITRTDGCVLRGSPDGNGPGMDWVTDCAAQIQLYNELTAALKALQP
jgi:hypothetical protein